VKVQNGEVTLTGTVDSREAKRMVEDFVDQVSGVKEVHNQLRVKEQLLGQSSERVSGTSPMASTTGSSQGHGQSPPGSRSGRE
jgi:hypothetical protein